MTSHKKTPLSLCIICDHLHTPGEATREAGQTPREERRGTLVPAAMADVHMWTGVCLDGPGQGGEGGVQAWATRWWDRRMAAVPVYDMMGEDGSWLR